MRLNFHGVLKDLYGDHFDMEASSIREAVEGFTRQQENWPRETLIMIIGYDDPSRLDECPDEIDLMPAFTGGKGKALTFILGAAMIGAAFFTGGASIVAGSLVTSGLGASLLVGGAMMILQGVIGLFMKAPTYSTEDDPEASKYVRVNKNTTKVGTPITLAYGTIKLGGHWLSLQSDSNNLSHGSFPATPT